MMISLVAAIGKNRELGKDNKLLWHISEDLKHFKEITSGHVVVMGRKTYESIGRLLPNRTNIVVTSDKQQVISKYEKVPEKLVVVGSLDEAIEVGMQYSVSSIKEGEEEKILNTKYSIHNTEDEVFIIGGGQIFEQALPIADRLYLTMVDATFDADTFFPDYSKFTKTISKKRW